MQIFTNIIAGNQTAHVELFILSDLFNSWKKLTTFHMLDVIYM